MTLMTTPTNRVEFNAIGSLSLTGAEISAFDPVSDRLFVTSNAGLQVVNLSNPAAPTLITNVDFTTLGFATTDVTSVAAKNGIVAVALPSADKLGGKVIFLDAATNALLGSADVGALPDMLTFTPDGTKVLVANEGEYTGTGEVNSPTTVGGKGSVSIIDISGGFGVPLPVQTAGFTSFDGQEEALRAAGVRIAVGQSVSDDIEPEYIAVSADGTKAMVTLQEANAVAILDIATATATFTSIVPLGTKNFSTLLADFSDRDSAGGTAAIKLETGNPVFGLYMPDGIDSYQAGGQTYYVIANEGDDRNDFVAPDEVIRLSDTAYDLDNTLFPNEATLKANGELGRLNVVNTPGLRGDTDGDGDIDQILTLGGRSFSILDANGAIVFDSGDIIERIVASFGLVANNTSPGFDDTRSDNKGPEPESIEIAEIGGRTYAMVGLERSHVTLAFDVTDPAKVTYAGVAQRPGDLNPEGGLFISADDSPTRKALYVTSNEVSNNISVFQVNETFTLQILHASDFEAGVEATTRAKNFAAIVDVLEDTYANSITLSSGDNFIPGAFTAAGTDPSVRDEIASFYEQFFGLPANSLTGIRNGTTPFNAADIAILNAIGVQASVLGNHDFDLGPTALAGAFDFVATLPSLPGQPTLASISNVGALFPYLSANVNFAAEGALSGLFTPTLQDATAYATTAAELSTGAGIRAEATGRELAPWTTINENGEIIGVLGLTTQVLASISTLGNVTVADPAGDGGVDNMAELAAIIQPLVDQMTGQGIDKIILLTHLQQFINEKTLAPLLRGVDVIIGGGSNTLLANATDALAPGDTADGTYPLFFTGLDGNAIAVVNTDGNYNYVGRLVVTFNDEGEIIPDRVDPAVSGAYVTTDAGVDAVAGNGDGTLSQAERDAIFADGTRGGEVKQITDAIAAVIEAKDGNILGYSEVFLEGRRNLVRTEETNLGNLTADANLWAAQTFDPSVVISLKNGGGIRAEIGQVVGQPVPTLLPPEVGGEVSQLDLENSLRFNNSLSLVTVTAEELERILEHAVAGSTANNTPGQFAQVSGIRFSYDISKTAQVLSSGAVVTEGLRIQSAAVLNADGSVGDVLVEEGALAGDPTRTFRLVTLGFLADGGDNYPLNFYGEDRVNLGSVLGTDPDYPDIQPAFAVGTEQDAFAEYMEEFHGTQGTAYNEADTSRAFDTRIQNLGFRADAVLDGLPAGLNRVGTRADDSIIGSDSADTISGLRGNDTIRGDAGSDSLSGGAGNDLLFGDTGADTLLGGAGDNTVLGGAGDDSITSLRGDDSILAGSGDDTVNAGGGDNIVDAAAGDDSVVAGAGADTILGGAGNDTIRGGINHDSLLGGDGNDLIDGEAGLDAIFGGTGADTLYGGLRADTIDGGADADLIDGGIGFDSLRGGAGADTISGGLGRDTIDGGADDDLLFGGIGLDRFIFGAGDGNDTIGDFQAGERIRIEDGLALVGRAVIDADLDDGADDLRLTFSDGGTITLIDVTRLSVFALDFA